MGFSAIFFIPRESISFFFFLYYQQGLNIVLMVSTVHEHGFVQSRHPGCSFLQMLLALVMLDAEKAGILC